MTDDNIVRFPPRIRLVSEQFASELDVADATRNALANYFIRRYRPGGFLTAVLAGDLFAAVCLADSHNITRIAEIARWIYDNAPSASFGSYAIVEAWLDGLIDTSLLTGANDHDPA